MPSVAPALGEIIRVSASEIEVQWSALLEEEAGPEVSTYLIKNRPIQTVRKRNADDMATVVETNGTSFVISKLDPIDMPMPSLWLPATEEGWGNTARKSLLDVSVGG